MFYRASLVSGAYVEVGADGRKEQSTPKELSTTPEMILLADLR
jgi:hypothetical protein